MQAACEDQIKAGTRRPVKLVSEHRGSWRWLSYKAKWRRQRWQAPPWDYMHIPALLYTELNHQNPKVWCNCWGTSFMSRSHLKKDCSRELKRTQELRGAHWSTWRKRRGVHNCSSCDWLTEAKGQRLQSLEGNLTHMISQASPLCCASWLVTRNLKCILAEGVEGK